MGARSRNISAIYIENNLGERFKFANNYLPGARAMARHVSNEGHTRDERGVHIVEIMNEMQQLKNFVRSARSNNYVNEDAQEIIEAATDRYYGLKDTLKAIASSKGYDNYFENWAPNVIEVEENDIEDLKTKLTRQVFDDRMVDSLPAVHRALNLKKEAKMDKDAETRSDAELDDIVAGKKASLMDYARSPNKIEVFTNPTAESELSSYFQIMKNSDMDTKSKNRNLITNVIEYISQNVTDDAIGNALSNIDMQDDEQYKAAVMLTKKFLQGKVDKIDPAPKKDLYGKTKEDVTFENYEARMNMISEGTWALPDNENDVSKLVELMKNPIPLGDAGEDATNAIGFALGDDELYDDLGDAGDKDPEADARPIISKWLEGAKDRYESPYDKFLQMAHEEITQGPKQGELPLGEDIDRESVNLDMVKPGLETLLSYLKGEQKKYYDERAETEAELKAKGMSDEEIEKDIQQNDYDFNYYNVDDIEDKIDALESLFKKGDADGNDIVATMYAGPQDTSPREDFMGEIKGAIKQYHPEVYDKLFKYDVGEAQDTNEAKATWPKSDDDESAPDIGDTVMHDKHGLVKVLKITDRDAMMEPAEYIVQTKQGKKRISFDQLVMGESITESPASDALQMAYDKVYNFVGEYDDEALEYLDDNAPIFSEMFDKYDGEIDDMANNLDANTLSQIMDELEEVASDLESGVLESKEVDEVAESIAKLKAMAGVGSKARSNHGIYEGEQGYQLTPRSIVARQMRKLQDIENKK